MQSKCKHCIYSSGERNILEIPVKKIKTFLKEAVEIGANRIHIAGGEPFVREKSDLYGVVEEAAKLNLKPRVLTNGLTINKKNIKELKERGLYSLLVSIDGLEKYHNNMRGLSSSFSKAIEALMIAKNSKLITIVNTVVTKENIKEIVDVLDITTKIPVDTQSFVYLTPKSRAVQLKHLMPSLSDWKNVKEKIYKYYQLKKSLHTRTRIQKGYIGEGERAYCRIKDKNNCLIMSDGEVFPCVLFTASPSYSLGNINKTSIKDIWFNSEKWKKYEEIFNKRRYSCDNCKNCEGGCIGFSNLLAKNIFECDPRCEKDNNLIPYCIREYETVESSQ